MSAPTLYVAEPGPSYLHRPRLVVDASVFAAVVFNEKTASEANSWLRGRTLCAPALVDLEVVNAGLNKLKRNELPLEVVSGSLEDFSAYDIERHESPSPAVFKIANKYRLSAYDAAYLWLAGTLAVPLATFDARLAEAAKKHLGGTPPST
jgi:predicted nucleic acid-binding protein